MRVCADLEKVGLWRSRGSAFPTPFRRTLRRTGAAPDPMRFPERLQPDEVRGVLLPDDEGTTANAAAVPLKSTAEVTLLSLEPGTPMRLHWTFGWADVFDALGGAPLLLRDGAIVNECNSGCGPVPRTGVEVTASGKILLVVVDRRQPRSSLGPTVGEFARIMKGLGAVDALNLDGGGSSTMMVKGEVVNRPPTATSAPSATRS